MWGERKHHPWLIEQKQAKVGLEAVLLTDDIEFIKMAQRLFLLPDERELGLSPRPNWRELAQLTPAREVRANTHLTLQKLTQMHIHVNMLHMFTDTQTANREV